MAREIIGYDAQGVALFTKAGSNAARISMRASADQRAINAQRAAYPTLYRVAVVHDGRVVDNLLLGDHGYLNPAKLVDGKWVLMFA